MTDPNPQIVMDPWLCSRSTLNNDITGKEIQAERISDISLGVLLLTQTLRRTQIYPSVRLLGSAWYFLFGVYPYSLNICRLYQQSLSFTKCHRTAAQLYSQVVPWESTTLLMACFQEKVSNISPGRWGGGVSVQQRCQEVHISGLWGQEGVSLCWREGIWWPPHLSCWKQQGNAN